MLALAKIKMSGFKSFVDPTVINLPSKLNAIVGPNGCGKSNIIDAVLWVMGENSPKYLRGESLTDVIFNGSSARKPIGQAAVELIFDNTDGDLAGEFAKFSEVSIKRVINRDSDSTYYLNGTRCRKKDVVSLFLGTGLGPRSYSIIGQNMISRIIEAKPDELRNYLEEAAGVSKYKDRRHETELRMQHTQENLERINDLRLELDNQLAHLKQQAATAEKYKTLKNQERLLRAQLSAIEWRSLDSKMVDASLSIQREETAMESYNLQIIKLDKDAEQLKHEQRVAQDVFQEVQRRYYAIGNEITRIEQDILHTQERQQQWENDFKASEQEWQLVSNQLAIAENDLADCVNALSDIEPKVVSDRQTFEELKTALRVAEEGIQHWQTQWDQFHQQLAKASETANIEKNNILHIEQKIKTLTAQQEQLAQNEGQFNFTQVETELIDVQAQLTTGQAQLSDAAQTVQDKNHAISQIQTKIKDIQQTLDRLRNRRHTLQGQQATLEALQQTALGQRNNKTAEWLQQHGLADNARLAKYVLVEKGWELAVEKVLGFGLQAVCVESLESIVPHLNDFTAGNLYLVANNNQESSQQKTIPAQALLEKVSSTYPIQNLLAGIYTAETVAEALAMRANLAPTESVITKDGVWISQQWLKILKEKDGAAGVFEREQELKMLTETITALDTEQVIEEDALASTRDALSAAEKNRDEAIQARNASQAYVSEMTAIAKVKESQLAQIKAQAERFAQDKINCKNALATAEETLQTATKAYAAATTALETQTAAKEALVENRDQARASCQTLRDQTAVNREALHQAEMQAQSIKSQHNALTQQISRLKQQQVQLEDKKTTLQSDLAAMQSIEQMKTNLSRTLDKHVTAENELNTSRIGMESLEQEARHLNELRQGLDRDLNKSRTQLEHLRVDMQGWKVKADTYIEQLRDTDHRLEDILMELPQDITAQDWQTKLDQINTRIARLGAINLVAIDEYATCQERKLYLDKQVEDLQLGLDTLQKAIEKIDKETKQRFKETFDQVNARFQELFPTVFGGGKAYLELTTDNYLDAGVTMMACPPGKRNSSIYLLSGGEKSLTAIALIFSIFYLNPAPFCLLDEVDAPLDDANVVRFTNLVRTMSEKTQFIFISHNKITIEMGKHLIGVTMNEPGVSRLVSVDVEKAISLAGT